MASLQHHAAAGCLAHSGYGGPRACADCPDIRGDLAYDVETVISELVTNAVNASTGPDDKPLYVDGRMLVVWLGLFTDGATLRAEVWDEAPGIPARRVTGADDVSGRGLDLVVGALSADWGWFPAQSGKCAWAEFRL